MESKNKIQKYMTLYMSIGMCFGVSGGLIYGMLLLHDNMALGMCLGISVGTGLGLAVGAAKDKRLSENMMEIIRMEEVSGTTDKMIYALDKSGVEKEYRVTEKKMKVEKFSVGDRVAEETNGALVSLESKQL